MTTLFTRHNESRLHRRRLNQKEHVERLLRSAIKEILVNENLLAKPTQDISSDWHALIQYARTPIGQPITETITARGAVLAEGIMDGLVNALKWTGSKLAGGLEALKNAGGKIFEATKKLMILALENIPGGQEALEFLSDFSGKIAEQIEEKFKAAKKQFTNWLGEMKGPIITFVLERAKETGVLEEIKAELTKKIKKESTLRHKKIIIESDEKNAADLIQNIIKDPKVGTDLFIGGARGALGKLMNLILKKTHEADNKLYPKIRSRIFRNSQFLMSPLGRFMIRIINLLGTSIETSLEEMINMASKVWRSIKEIASTGGGTNEINLSDRSDIEFLNQKTFPNLVGAIIGGESTIETIISASLGDVKSIVQLLMSAINKIKEAILQKLQKLTSQSSLLSLIGLKSGDPESQEIKEKIEQNLPIKLSKA